MKRIALLSALCLLLLAACQRRLSRKQVKEHLEEAMGRHLQQHQSSNAPQLHFDVLDVEFFEDVKQYDCEFKVKMTLPDGRDTIGIMKRNFSKDFSAVE